VDAEGARQRGRPSKTGKDVVNRDMNDLHIKPSDAVEETD